MEISFTSAERSIPPALRRAVIGRDGMTCRRCGRAVRHRSRGEGYAPDHIHLDHIEEWAAGGGHTLDNLIVSCADCNLRRPKPKHVVRTAKVRAEYRSGTYWWLDGYVPPVIADGETVSIPHLVRHFGPAFSAIEILRAIARGDLPATAASPIRVQPPEELGVLPAQIRRAREEREAAYQARKRARQRERRRTGVSPQTPRTSKARPPSPERVEYWRNVIKQARAERRGGGS